MVSIADNAPARTSLIPFYPWGYVAVSVVAVAAVLAAPLAAYVAMISLFGLPHVLCELRYCDERFSARAPRAALFAIGVLLLALGGLRIAQAVASVPTRFAVWGELGLGVALAATAAWFMPRRRIIGALAGSALAAGAAFAPIATFLVVAWLHNLTPLGFVAEIVPKRERARAVAMLLVPFILVPAIIASGLPQKALHDWLGYSNLYAPSLFGAGRYPLAAFLTQSISFPHALPLFSAAVAAQAMHYLSVILVMPRLLKRYGTNSSPPPLAGEVSRSDGGGTSRKTSPHPGLRPDLPRERGRKGSLVPWPSWPVFYASVAGLALFVFAAHAIDYKTARSFYSVAAAIHSWVELPIFLLALGVGFTARESLRPENTR